MPSELDVARLKLIAAEEALRRYGRHESRCGYLRGGDEGVSMICDCGLLAAIDAVKAEGGQS